MRKSKTTFSDLICSECGSVMTISRKICHQREYLHIKDLYCICCDKITKHYEVHDITLLKKKFEFQDNLNEKEETIKKLLLKKEK